MVLEENVYVKLIFNYKIIIKILLNFKDNLIKEY